MRFLTTIPLLFLVLVACPTAAWSQGESNSLENLKFKFGVERERLGKPKIALDEQFKSRLEKLEDEYADMGELERVLVIREEIKAFAGGTHATAEDFPELARIQGIYDKELAKIVSLRDEKMEKLLSTYQVRLEVLARDLTKQRKIDEAVAANKELEMVVADLGKLEAEKEKKAAAAQETVDSGEKVTEFKWDALGAATLVEDEGSKGSVGVGPGKGMSVIYVKKSFPKKFKFRGEYHVSGPWVGFVFGLDPRRETFMKGHSAGEDKISMERVDKGVRKALGIEEIGWRSEEWTRFEIARDGDDWTLKLGTDSLEFQLPRGIDGKNVGLVSFDSSSMLVRRLSLIGQ